MDAHRVHSKVRSSVKRREDVLEEEEMEAGEINLVPYLDIVTNLMLFLLMSVSTNLMLGQINTVLPDRGPPANSTTPPPPTNPDDIPLQLVISVKRDAIVLWSLSGMEGTLAAPKAVIELSGGNDSPCDGDYMCQSGACSAGKCVAGKDPPAPAFNYEKLNKALIEIATRRYLGKPRSIKTFQAFLNVDYAIPYSTIIAVMSTMRCKLPAFGAKSEGCLLPTEDEEFKKQPEPINKVLKLFDPTRANYDPETMALFHDVAFLEITGG